MHITLIRHFPVETNPDPQEGSCDRTHLNLKSVKKINFGDCQPIVLACSVIMNIWWPYYNSFSNKQLEINGCDHRWDETAGHSSHLLR
jgi:hypothetical protein